MPKIPVDPLSVTAAWMSEALGADVRGCELEQIGIGIGVGGRDGERYAWSDIEVVVIRDGRVASACMFDLDDEAAAFAYAEERIGSVES